MKSKFYNKEDTMATQLPSRKQSEKVLANGCCTPKEDKLPQKACIPPKRVLPIIFLPGIMGSNLRVTSKRQGELGKSNNIAWRPDRKKEAAALIAASSRTRQMQLDPSQTEVDIYNPKKSETGDVKESSAERHDVDFSEDFSVGIETVLLCDDPVGTTNAKTKKTKAMERGWGEVYLSSYKQILEVCEQQLNGPTDHTLLNSRIFGTKPAIWGAHTSTPMTPLTAGEYQKAVKGCFFPVHAIGYNWLKSNAVSAKEVRVRILKIIKDYQEKCFVCEKVILVTHSMGGLLARALVHPEIGAMGEYVLGVVHGVMPAIGAPAAYRRIRCGTESGAWNDPAYMVLGSTGAKVTAVLGNAQGGLELLPSKAYGNGWLEVRQGDTILKKLPQQGDPYREIYQLKDPWFRMIREEWLNPAELDRSSFANTCELLEGAKAFHDKINSTYHALSYAHYGADPTRSSWEKVTWELDPKYRGKEWEKLKTFSDEQTGTMRLFESDEDAPAVVEPIPVVYGGEADIVATSISFSAKIGASTGAGDQTVPIRSADQQLLSKKFVGVFRQVGYEHQKSYSDPAAISSTLYSLVRIIEKMTWQK